MAALRARHRISRWGATDEEATCSLAGGVDGEARLVSRGHRL